MINPEVLFIFSALVLLVSSAVLSYYLPKIRSVSNAYREASEVVTAIVKELRDRQDGQDLKIADQLVRLETLEVQLHRDLFTSQVRRTALRDEIPARQDVYESRSRDFNPSLYPLEGVSQISQTSHRVSNNGSILRPTATEHEVLLILQEKVLTAREIQKAVGKSREHTARVLKNLSDRGYISRKENQRPYIYEISSRNRAMKGFPT